MKPTIRHAYYTCRFSGHGPVHSALYSILWYCKERIRIRRLRAFLFKHG